MSTRSVICGMTAEGPKVNFIRFDGYPEFPGVGSKLVAFYSEPEAARTLLALGDMVTLGKSLDACEIPEEFKTSKVAYPVEEGSWECMPGPYGAKQWESMSIEQGYGDDPT